MKKIKQMMNTKKMKTLRNRVAPVLMAALMLLGGVAVAEDAFARGIGRAVEEKFSLEEGSVDVKVIGFDFEKMRAESIKIILSGRSVVADYRGIEKYVNSMEIGKCEVVIEIG